MSNEATALDITTLSDAEMDFLFALKAGDCFDDLKALRYPAACAIVRFVTGALCSSMESMLQRNCAHAAWVSAAVAMKAEGSTFEAAILDDQEENEGYWT